MIIHCLSAQSASRCLACGLSPDPRAAMCVGRDVCCRRHLAPPLLYEASVRVPLGDGLSLCGSTLATHRPGRGTSLAYAMKACYEY